jgi:hypothetical protein
MMFIHWNLGRLKIHKSRIDGKLQCPPFIDDFPTKEIHVLPMISN